MRRYEDINPTVWEGAANIIAELKLIPVEHQVDAFALAFSAVVATKFDIAAPLEDR